MFTLVVDCSEIVDPDRDIITQDTEHNEKISLALKLVLLSRKVTMTNTLLFPTDSKFMAYFGEKYRRCVLNGLSIVKVGLICHLANCKSCFTPKFHVFVTNKYCNYVYLCSTVKEKMF